MKNIKIGFYSKKEEFFNCLSHAIGVVLSIIFMALLVYKGILDRSPKKVIGFSIYGLGLISMFLASSLYHGAKSENTKKILRVFDHSAIFLCIAATYTPIALLVFNNKLAIIVLSIVWSIAILGIGIKIISSIRGNFHKYNYLSLIMYLIMGWLAIFLIRKIIKTVGLNFFLYLLTGGLFYSVGVFFYKNKKIKYNHAIWHLFILAGSISMFLGIYKYLA